VQYRDSRGACQQRNGVGNQRLSRRRLPRHKAFRDAQRQFDSQSLTSGWHCRRCGKYRSKYLVVCSCGGLAPAQRAPECDPALAEDLPLFGQVAFTAGLMFCQGRVLEEYVTATLDVGGSWRPDEGDLLLRVLIARTLQLMALETLVNGGLDDEQWGLVKGVERVICREVARSRKGRPAASWAEMAVGRGRRS
jgi:hypothetical protein